MRKDLSFRYGLIAFLKYRYMVYVHIHTHAKLWYFFKLCSLWMCEYYILSFLM